MKLGTRINASLARVRRGLMMTFGMVVLKGAGRVFESHVCSLLASNAGLEQIILPVLEAWRGMSARTAELSKQLVTSSRASEQCQLLSSIPGVGAVTASSFVAAIEDPENFKKPRSVGALIGLTTRRHQSGEVDYDGQISRRGDNHLRGLLYEAAVVILSRTTADSARRIWSLKLQEKVGFKRAAVAVARKLAVIMHTILKTGELFDRSIAAEA